MNTLLAILKVTDARRDVILAGGLYHRSVPQIYMETPPPPLDLSNVKMFQKNSLFQPKMILRPLFCFKETKNTGLLIFNFLKQKKLIFNFYVNCNWKKLTDSRKRAKIKF